MNSRERVSAALAHQATDLIPVHHVGFSSDVASAILGHEAYVGGGIQQWREATAWWQGEAAHEEYLERSYQDAIAVGIAGGNDFLRPSYWRYNHKPTRRVDANTFLYEHGPEEDWRVLEYDPQSEQCDVTYLRPRPPFTIDTVRREVAAAERELASYTPSEQSYAFEIRAQRELGDQYAIRVGGVAVGIPLRGIEAWLEALVLEPELIARHLDIQVERARRNIAFLAPLGFRAFWGGLDFASNEGPMFSPRIFREMFVPRMRAVTEACHAVGGRHFFASDGEFWSVTDALFGEKAVDGYFEIDGRAGMDLRKLRAKYPDLILIGNISSHNVHMSTKEAVVEETLRALEAARSTTGVIVGVSNYFVPNTPIENALAVIETINANR